MPAVPSDHWPLAAGIALDFGSPEVSVGDQLRRYLPLIATAEQGGFGSIWLGETYSRAAPEEAFHLPSPFGVLGALSQHTGMRLGTGVLLALAWPPLRLAYEAAVLDQLTQGRLVVGLGLGPAPLAARFGTAPAGPGPWIEESLAALRALWAGQDGYRGATLEVAGGIFPRPAQPGGPPLLVGGGRVLSARRAARLGDGWYASSAHPFERIAQLAAAYRAERAALDKAAAGGRTGGAAGSTAGEPRRAPTVSVNRITIVAPEQRQAEELARTYAGRLLAHYGRLGALPDFPAAATLGPDEAFATVGPHVALVGTPAMVAEKLAAYHEAGVTDVAFRVCPPGLPLDAARRTVDLLAGEVLGSLGPAR